MLLLFSQTQNFLIIAPNHDTPSKAAEHTAAATVGLASTHCILSRCVCKIEQEAIDEYHNPR